MKDYFKPKTWLIAILMFIVAFGLSSAMVYYEFGSKKNIRITRASANDNVSGWAWNANIGWISFNCTNDNPPCANSNYGVSIDLATGNFSGYAWSSGVGWISFNRSTCAGGDKVGEYCTKNSDCTPNPNFCRLDGPGAAGAPLYPPFSPPASLDYIAKYNSGTGEVDGWAKILAMGDNGWISFNRKTCVGGSDAGAYCTASGDCSSNNCSLSGLGGYPLTINPTTGDFSGWAWNGNTDTSGIGWISFNCANESSPCFGTNYKVVANTNRPPTVTNLTAPNWSYLNAGQFEARYAKLGWTFSDSDAGSSESVYQVIINTQNNINNPVFDSGECLGMDSCRGSGCVPSKCRVGHGPTGTTYFFPLGAADGLNYGIAYYWWVKVWDNYDVASNLTQYNTSQDTPYPEADDADPLTFTTYKHEMPEVDFTWFPLEPSKGEEVKLTDQSKVYNAQPDINPADCTDALCDWEWSSISPGVTFKDSVNGPTPIIIFNQAGNPTITLKVKDFDDYIIYRSKTINVNANLPGWKEVKPE